MRRQLGQEWQRTVSRIVLVGLVGGMSGACGADMARFSEPFGNPFAVAQTSETAEAEPTRTGSIAAPTGRVESRPVSPPIRVAAVPAAPPGPAASPRQAVVNVGAGGWTAQGGTTVTVGSGDSLATLSDRYGVPTTAILSVNGLSGASQVAPGRRLVIPVYNAAGAAPRTRVASIEPIVPARSPIKLVESSKPTPAKPEDAKARVRPGQAKAETVKVAAKPEPVKPQVKLLAKAAEPAKAVKVEAKVVRSEPIKVAKAEPVKAAKVEQPAAREPAKASKVETPVIAKAEPKAAKPEPVKAAKAEAPAPQPVRIARIEAPTPQPTPVKAVEAPKPAPAPVAAAKEPGPAASAPAATAATPSAEFRWPARGRIITGFGAGSGNEGINIAVPEGTPVKAAERGVVAYAGDQVKGYGNLVLIRHDNGYVSAYAHNGEVKVKKGEKIDRGQVIAKSGQTGNVTSPQLHFEIRKGSTPVDPVTHLASQ